MRRLMILLLPCAALGIAACDDYKTAPRAAVITPPHTIKIASSTRIKAPTKTPPRAPTCRASTLALSYLGSQGANENGLLGFALKNTGTTTCSMIGYPGVRFLNHADGSLPTTVTHTTHDYSGPAPKVLLTVAPGSTVSFQVSVTHVAAANAMCTTAAALQVVPPNDTSTLRVMVPDGAYYCQSVTVSPVRPGTSAYPTA